jgi:hypothetical protein
MSDIIRAKWAMDGATTLAEAAAKLRAFADELDRMHAGGYRLEDEVADDYGLVLAPGEEPGGDEYEEALGGAALIASLKAEQGSRR